MTSDGISTADWDRIHALALAIVNASSANDEGADERALSHLLIALDELETKYGRKPSLLATRADFVESSEERGRLFEEAYEEATRINDPQNREAIAHSLTEFYLEEMQDREVAATWFRRWREYLGVEPDEDQRDEINRLEELLLEVENNS